MSTLGHEVDRIHVVCIADKRYGPYAGITLCSVLASNKNQHIHVHLFSDGIARRDIDRTERMARHFNSDFSVYNIQEKLEDIPGLPRSIHHYTRATFGRLFLPEFLSTEIKQAIYLDSDIICIASLHDLWTLGQGIKLLGAVRDIYADEDREHKIALGMPADHAYYNAGMLVINVEEWRRQNVGERILHFLSQQLKTKHGDQDVINAVFWEEITELPRRWNVLATSPNPDELFAQLADAANIHYAGAFKPWHFGYALCGRAGAGAFRHAKAASPWRWMLPDLHFARIKRKIRAKIVK